MSDCFKLFLYYDGIADKFVAVVFCCIYDVKTYIVVLD